MISLEMTRFLMAFLGGVLLTLSGGMVQGVTHNELAGPSTLGMEGFSVLFIIIVYLLKIMFPSLFSIMGPEFYSFILFVIFVALFYLLSKKRKKQLIYGNKLENKMGRFLLLGLCFNLFIGAIFSVLHFLFMNMNREFPSQIWFGNFRFIPDSYAIFILPITIMIYLFSLKLSKKINYLIYGEDFALGLGINVEKVQREAIFLSLLSQGVVVSFFGVFAFLAIIFPHFLRSFSIFKSRFDLEMKYGSLVCGLLMMSLDMFCYYNPIYGAEIPVGMVSSVIGPLFLMLLVFKRPNLFIR